MDLITNPIPNTGVEQIVTNKIIKIYPTITDRSITIENPTLEKEMYVKIYSLSGKLKKVEIINSKKCNIDIGDLENGLYFISLYQQNKRIITKHLIIGPSKLIIQNLDSNLLIIR
jgi:hypothetical protein